MHKHVQSENPEAVNSIVKEELQASKSIGSDV